MELEENDQYEALEFGAQNDLTYYDSVYVTATKKVKTALLTADDVLCKRVGKEVPVMHLRTY